MSFFRSRTVIDRQNSPHRSPHDLCPVARAVQIAAEALESRLLLAGGDPDPTFGTNGLLTLPGGGPADVITDLKPVAGGMVLALLDEGSGDVVVRRFSADGTPDDSFGAGGR